MRKIANIPTNLAKVYTNGAYLTPPHIQLIESKLLEVANGQCKRLIINMPPRHGKSELISKFFPAWYLYNFSKNRVILTSYSSDLAVGFTRNAKDIYYSFIESDNKRKNTQDYWETTEGGSLFGVGVGGSLTGKGANVIIIDDPIKSFVEANSQTQRDKLYDWYRSTLYTRLEPDGAIILVQTRWHDDDLAGRLIKEENEEWEVLTLSAISENNEPLWKSRYSLEELNKIKTQLGSYWFGALYQQNPIANENVIFKQSYWQYYKTLPSNMTYIVQSWDTAFKEKQQNDYSVCVTIGFDGKNYYVIDVFRKKYQYPDLKRAVKSLYLRDKPLALLIEDSASGQALIPDLKSEHPYPIKEVKGSDKVVRAHLVSPLCEAHNVYLPENAPWLIDFITELAEFPLAKHDDQVDAFTHALQYLKQYGQPIRIISNKRK